MNEIERQILESLQFLVSMQNPNSERYQDKQSDVMSKNHLLLHPIKNPPIQDKTKQALSDDLRD